MEKALRNVEIRHSVRRRWMPGEQEFDSAAHEIEKERRVDTISALHSLSIERYFLLTLKKKYAGNLYFVMF